MAGKGKKAEPINPFKIATNKDKNKKAGALDHLNNGDEITKAAVDEYKRLAAEVKKLEGERDGHKAVIEPFARLSFAERQMKEVDGNFYIDGNKDSVQFQAQNAGSYITAEDHASLSEDYGEEAVEDLLQVDFSTLKLNAEKMKDQATYDKVVAALQTLPAEILEGLFTPACYKVQENVLVKMRKHCENAAEYQGLLQALKIKNFIKA